MLKLCLLDNRRGSASSKPEFQALFDNEELKLLIWALSILCYSPEAKAVIVRVCICPFYLHTFVCIRWYYMSATETTVQVLSLWKMTEA